MTYLLKRKNSGFGLGEELERAFNSCYAGSVAKAENIPLANIWETEESYDLELSIPGFGRSDLEIEVKDNLLTIRTKDKEAQEEKREFRLREFNAGAFSRSFVLPRNADKENIQAKAREGVLALTIPKVPEAKPRQIKING